MYDDFDFANRAFCPGSGISFHLDELPILHTATFVAIRYTQNYVGFRGCDRYYGSELETVASHRFPYDIENIWKQRKVFMLVDYLGCPILCHINIEDYYEKSKNN